MAGKDKKVMVLILTVNQLEFTRDCIASLLKSDYPNIDVVVVDNGSTDGTSETLKKEFSQAVIIRSDTNVGAAGGRNIGINYFLERGDCDYLFFLDNDTVIDKSAVSELVKVLKSGTGAGIAMAVMCYYDRPGVVHMGGGCFVNWKKGFFDGLLQDEDIEKMPLLREVECAPTAMMMVCKEAVQKAGLFDERYFIYFEDSDWALKVRRAGYKILATSRAKVWHKVSQSMGKESPLFYYYRTRNRLLFMKKNATAKDRMLFPVYFLIELLSETIPTLVLNKQYRQLKGVFSGIFDHFAGRYGEKKLI